MSSLESARKSFEEASKKLEFPATCFSCGKESQSLKTCSGCKVAHYCDRYIVFYFPS